MIRVWLAKLAGSLTRRRSDRDLEEELRFHLDQEIQSAARTGAPPDEAARAARLHAGQITQTMEALRDQRGAGPLEDFAADLRHAARTLWRRPGFTLMAGAALAFAVAAHALVFAVADGVLLKPLPYREPDRLVRVFESGERRSRFPVSIGCYKRYATESATLDGIGLYTGRDFQLMHGDRPERLRAMRVTPDFFPTLGVTPILGRNFGAADTIGDQKVVILSHAIWTSRFGADSAIIGKPIRLDRESWTVIGVLPQGFQHVGGDYRSTLQGDTVALWAPQRLDLRELAQWAFHFTNAVARLKPGVTIDQARRDLDRIAADVQKRYPQWAGKFNVRVEPLAGEVVGGARTTVILLEAAGAFVLLIACVNVAGLCVARAFARRREMAIRAALGATGGRLIRAALAENLLLGLAGGAAGLAIAHVAFPLLRSLLPAEFPRLHEVAMTPVTAAVALATGLATSIVAGLIPALRLPRVDPNSALDSRGASSGRHAARLRTSLVAIEAAFAATLCVCAVLLVRSSQLLDARPHGFDPANVVTFGLNLPGTAYGKPEAIAQFYERAIDRLRQIPGVEAAGIGTDLPWTGYDDNSGITIPGWTGSSTLARYHAATRGYFEALRVPLVAGRFIDERDHAGAQQAVVVNEVLVKRFFKSENMIGRVIDVFGQKRQVVGIVADIQDRPSDLAAEPAYWMAMPQQPFGQTVAAVRVKGDPTALGPAIEQAFRELDAELPLADRRLLSDIAAAALAERRFALRLFQVFAALALALAAFGVYGLLAHAAQQRRKELAIRSALGATRENLLWLVLREGAMLGGIAVAAGAVLGPVAGRLLSSLLYGVKPADPVALITGPALLLVAALAASFVPAWSASRAQPMKALREE